MTRVALRAILCACLLAAVYACDPPPADGDAGADLDCDSDSDSDVDCESEPETCEDLGESELAQTYGCCLGDVLYNCADGGDGMELESTDCAELGAGCSYDWYESTMGCVVDDDTDPCADDP